jgi:heptosyltransferase-3
MSTHERPNLLIFRIGSLGDTVVALPCFHAIARRYPQHRKILLTNSLAAAKASSVEDLLRGTGLIDDTLYFPAGGGNLRYSWTLARKLRQLEAEALIYLTPRHRNWPPWRDLAFFRMAGLRRIVGAPLTTRMRECHVDPVTGELEYEAERLARTLRPALQVDLSPANWDLRLSAAERAAAARHLAPLPARRDLVAVAPGARVAVKDWGEDNWARLLRPIQPPALRAVSLVFVGVAEERALADRLARSWSGPHVNLCGELTPRESAAVLERCVLLVCHDSGPMHLAASQGTACVALFGNFNRPHQWFPFGNRHYVIHDPRGVRHIEVEQVAQGIEAVLRATQQVRFLNDSLQERHKQSLN